MTRARVSANFAALLALAGCAPAGGVHEPPEPASAQQAVQPRLLVYVVVDQLRADLLDIYAGAFTGGLARLRTEGYRFTNATFDHSGTETAAGHATAATGVHPSRHGVVVNTWRERRADGQWQSVYGVRDLGATIVGAPDLEGRGPANLLRGGLPDWIEQADPGSIVVSLSGKDRAAVTMAGRTRGHAYWFNGELGRFLTSTHYRAALPDWVDRFNREALPPLYRDTIWTSTVPPQFAGLTRPDTFPHEGDGVNTYFPHRASLEARDTDERSLNAWRGSTPYPDVLVLQLARTAIRELSLGQRGSLDYLALAPSQTDHVGHGYGPRSREQLDNLLRLDRELGAFFDFLDATVGRDRWVLGLTADHGVLEIPEARAQFGLHGRRIGADQRNELVRAAQVAADGAGTDARTRARAAAQAALAFDWVVDAFAWEDVLREQPADSFRVLYTRSWHPERAHGPLGHLGVAIRVEEGGLLTSWPFGTSHGSPYLYDRHVPFILVGAGVTPGESHRRVSVVDLAPTLARLANVPVPGDLDGIALYP